jgi:hypothetical protein
MTNWGATQLENRKWKGKEDGEDSRSGGNSPVAENVKGYERNVTEGKNLGDGLLTVTCGKSGGNRGTERTAGTTFFCQMKDAEQTDERRGN